MDMPPSGWYPDPYGVRGLLRWWDGSVWTEHTQSQDAPPTAPGSSTPASGAPAAGASRPGAGAPGAAEETALDVRPAERTTLDGPSPTVGPSPTALELPSAVERTVLDMPPVLDTVSNPPGSATAMFSAEEFTGYARAQRQRQIRRRWIMAALATVTAVVLVVIVLAVVKLGKQPTKPLALDTRPTHAAKTASPSPSPSPSATGPAFAGKVTDGSSGLSYGQLGAPWQASCPGAFDQQGFGWTAGEFAVAGTVSGQDWYANACSGLLPAQYGYTSVANLSSTVSTLATTFENTFYNGMAHTVSQLSDAPLQVSGAAAWEIKFLVSYSDPSSVGATWSTEEGAVLVADRGAGNQPAVFYVSVPSNLGTGDVGALMSSLTLSAVTAPASTPATAATTPSAATTTASPTATATTGGGGFGGGGGNGGGGNGGGPGGGGGGGF
jgi:hypothetical protein